MIKEGTIVVDDLGPIMQTVSGRDYHPLNPQVGEICLSDIASALAKQCRFGGHTRYFYSVAEHLYRASKMAENEQFEALMHDASEAYLQDVPKPIKHSVDMGPYREAEHKWNVVLSQKFGFGYPFCNEVKWVDNALLHLEAYKLLPAHRIPWLDHELIQHLMDEGHGNDFTPMHPADAELMWLARFEQLRPRE